MKNFYIAAGAFMLFLFLFTQQASAQNLNVKRMDGQDRFDVAIHISQEGWPSGSKMVFIANYLKFPDALSASPLAYKNHAPILLTRPDALPQNISHEIKRLNPNKIVIVGGRASVTDHVFSQLEKFVGKGNVARIGGHDRFEVASNISKQLGQSQAILVNGLVFSDALTIAPYAAQNGIPILLTKSNVLPDSTKKALAGKTTTLVIGGKGSVGQSVYDQLNSPRRIGGKDRYEVNAHIVQDLNQNADRIFLTTGLKFADALTGSVLAAKQNASLLLTRPDRLPVPAEKIVLNNKTNDFVVLGGTASVQPQVVDQLKPIYNTHSIEGYSDKISYYPGETVHLMVDAPEGRFSVDVERFGSTVKSLYKVSDIKGERQDYFPRAYKEGALWEPSFHFTIPSDWPSGMYAAKIYDNANKFYITFIVKNRNPAPNGIGVIASTNTWQAYNSWDHYSLYSNHLVNGRYKNISVVSFDRPNPGADPTISASHLAGGEKYVLKWLEDNHYPYSMITDTDIDANPSIFEHFNTIIINTHSEYWTKNMLEGLKHFLDQGGNLLYLSGNGLYWRAVIKDNQIEVQRDGSPFSFNNQPGGTNASLGWPESAILGVRYHSSEFSIPAPYKVLNRSSWVFAHTGLQNGDLIGKTGLNQIRNSSGAASGWETDQPDLYTPDNAVVLAKGINKTGAGAVMLYYDHPGGGGVFSVGSITFGGSLVVDDQLSQIVKNVLNHFQAQ